MESGDMQGYLMVIRTFRQPGANELVDGQRLTSSSAPFLSSWPMESGDMRGYLMVIRTFHQPGANEPVDAQRLTSSSAPFSSSWPMESGDMRGYRMVTRTFRQPRANEPVDAQRLTLSSAPFAIQGQRVRWQVEIPYGHPHFSSTEANEFDGISTMLVVRFWLFSRFLQVLILVVRRHSSPTMHEILLCWTGMIKFDGVGKCRGCPALSFSRHWSFVDASDAFSFFLNDRFRWSGY